MNKAFNFPGQGSQYVGMGLDLYNEFLFAQEYYEVANEILGYDLARVCFYGPKEKLLKTQFTQPAIFVHSIIIDSYLKNNDIPGLFDIDTRAVTKKIRSTGSMMGCITNNPNPEEELKKLLNQPHYLEVNHVLSVSSNSKYDWNEDDNNSTDYLKIAVIDCGVKFNILKSLSMRGCKVEVFPVNASLEKILENNPDGIVISPGPGDPSMLDQLSNTVEELINTKPMFGICLGNQILALAAGENIYIYIYIHIYISIYISIYIYPYSYIYIYPYM